MKRGLSAAAAAAAGALLLSGCSGPLPVAYPAMPQSEEYTKAPLRAGDGSEFVSEYTKKLQKALEDDGKGLDEIQGGPMLDRTKAEVLIAKAEKKKLGTVGFDTIIAAGPPSSEYPLWFLAFASTGDDKTGTQAMLVSRSDANADWIVQQGLFIGDDRVPKLESEGGAVSRGGSEFAKEFGTAVSDVREYLSGTKGDALEGYDVGGRGFSNFRDYVDIYDKDKKSFENVTTQCQPYADIDFEEHSIKTKTGAVALAEMRCTINIQVPGDYNFTLPKQVSAITTGDKKGNRVQLEASVPFLIETTGGKTKLTSSDWFPLSGKQSSAKKDDRKKDGGKDSDDKDSGGKGDKKD